MVCPSVDFQAVTSTAKYCSRIILDDFSGVLDTVWFLTGFLSVRTVADFWCSVHLGYICVLILHQTVGPYLLVVLSQQSVALVLGWLVICVFRPVTLERKEIFSDIGVL